ncbi:MAG: hypothetical protein WKG07_18595 [Hymenobacter sp.]
MSYSELPEGTRVKYDKQGLVKTGTLKRLDISRRQLHQYNLRPDKPREVNRENRDLRKKGHKNRGKDNDDKPRGKAAVDSDTDPAADPTPARAQGQNSQSARAEARPHAAYPRQWAVKQVAASTYLLTPCAVT